MATVGFNVVRLALMVWTGYVVVRFGHAGLWAAVGSGPAIMVVDHILLKGGTFLILQLSGQHLDGFGEHSYLMAFGGVVVSFIMFSPLAGLLGLCGGLLGRRRHVPNAA